MKITFKHGRKKTEAQLAPSTTRVKLYSVPKEYSSDGYAVCAWGAGELEPVPASSGLDTILLYAGRIEHSGQNVTLEPTFIGAANATLVEE